MLDWMWNEIFRYGLYPIEKIGSVPRVYPWVNAGGYFDIIGMTWRRDYPATQHIELNITSCGYQNTGVGS